MKSKDIKTLFSKNLISLKKVRVNNKEESFNIDVKDEVVISDSKDMKNIKNIQLNKVKEVLIPATNIGGKKLDWVMSPFKKYKDPIIIPSDSGFDSKNTYNMAVIKEGNKTIMIYRGEDKNETSAQCTGRLGIAISDDGVHFKKETKPILVPDKPYDKQGVEDPRLIKVGDTYYLTYTGFDGKTARLCLAVSKDLRHWDKKGPLFPNFPGKTGVRSENWTKSGAILPERIKEGPFKGKYIMYFGDTDMWLGYSDDLIHWDYVKEPVLRPRDDKFDSRMVEPGPPPIMTKDGILLIYNSSDKPKEKGKNFGAYRVGAVLFDKKDPTKVLKRIEEPLLEPTQDWEKNGYVDNVCFVEGLTLNKGKWHLYYGGADRYIGLAIADFNKDMFDDEVSPITNSASKISN